MDINTVVFESVSAEVASVGSEAAAKPTLKFAARASWTRDVDALCRALDAQQRAHFQSIPAADK